MPLVKSKDKKFIGTNYKAERNAGKSKAQSLAIALSVARAAGANIPKNSRNNKVIKKAK